MAWGAFGQTLPDGPGKETFQTVCGMCHSPNAVIGKQGTEEWWQSKVTEMLQEETDIPSADVDTIVAYLAKNFPVVKVNVNKATAKDLETGLELTSKESEAIVQYRAYLDATQSKVEVPEAIADRIIKALSGTTLRGDKVEVRRQTA